MNEVRFAKLLAVYGAEPVRWPTEDQAAALALIARSGKAAAMLAEADKLDRAIEASSPHATQETLARLRRQISADIARLPAPSPCPRLFGALSRLEPFVPAGVSALAVLTAGFAWIIWGSPDQSHIVTGLQTLTFLGSLL
ncbi:hypothetical protein ROTAS13_02254 [Roseomonas sp. TAS13]|uniref:hypothetical protein n=1 Tax=Roseomonas sp. TAS13 TaxID=1926319 RepID=UPI00095E131B|nr:hypothetical protein [Roseomonas sp. TAS13]USQ74203.1 hypothetical protein NF552_23725 [Roseomonas mucosa]GAV34586.1 hypothetical protein ROTAS13_02254 [Roseomonas sp. TAS13]